MNHFLQISIASELLGFFTGMMSAVVAFQYTINFWYIAILFCVGFSIIFLPLLLTVFFIYFGCTEEGKNASSDYDVNSIWTH